MCGEYAENSLVTFVENFFKEEEKISSRQVVKKNSIDLRNEIKRLLNNIFYILWLFFPFFSSIVLLLLLAKLQ